MKRTGYRRKKRSRKKGYAVVLILMVLCMLPVFEAPRVHMGDRAMSARLLTSEVADGYPLLLEIATEDSAVLRHITAAHQDTTALRVYTHPVKPAGAYFALMGVPYEAKPGQDAVQISWTEDDMAYTRVLPYTIIAGPYEEETIQGVPQSRVTPSAADVQRIAAEQEEIARAYVAVRDTAMMAGPFDFPVEPVTITSAYGTRRMFNGQLRSYHGGLDMRAYDGTPIYAAQAGVVKLAKNLFYAGNHVIIEHGMGIHSSYSHLSRMDVKPGQWVEKGQILGLSGATGRVTAAHLHWTVTINGVGVSPLPALELLSLLYRSGS